MGNYVIDIYVHGAEEGDGEYTSNYPDSSSKAGGGKKEDTQTNWQKFQGAYKQVTKAYTSMSLVRNVFAFELSRVGVEDGNSVTQNKINFAMDVAGQVGTVAGAFILGGAVAGVMALAGIGVSYMQKASVLEYEKGKESIALNQMRVRAGLGFNRSRRE